MFQMRCPLIGILFPHHPPSNSIEKITHPPMDRWSPEWTYISRSKFKNLVVNFEIQVKTSMLVPCF